MPQSNTNLYKSLGWIVFLFILIIIEVLYIYIQDPRYIASDFPQFTYFFVCFQFFFVFLLLISILKQSKSGDKSKISLKTAFQFNIKVIIMLGISYFFFNILRDVMGQIFGFASNNMGASDIILNLTIVVLGLAIVSRIFTVPMGGPKGKLFIWLKLFYSIVMYVPCLVGDVFDVIAKDYKLAPNGTGLLLLAEVFLIGLNYVYPYLLKLMYGNSAKVILVEKHVTSDEKVVARAKDLIENYDKNINYGKSPYYPEYNTSNDNKSLMSIFSSFNPKKSAYDRFSISSWVYLNPQPPSKSYAYNKYTTLFRYGEMPIVKYNMKEGSLIISAATMPEVSDSSMKKIKKDESKIKIIENKVNIFTDQISNIDKQLKILGNQYEEARNNRDESAEIDIQKKITELNKERYIKQEFITNSANKISTLFNNIESTWSKEINEHKKTIEVYETKDFPLQRWNNIVINYDSGMMDIFINNELVKSHDKIISFQKISDFVIGEKEGLYAFVKNIRLYPEPLSRASISAFYNLS